MTKETTAMPKKHDFCSRNDFVNRLLVVMPTPPPVIKNSIIEIAVPLPLFQTFHYRVPERSQISTGSRVRVNFKNRKLLAYVVGFPASGHPKTKDIIEMIDEPPLFSQRMLEFFQWISIHYSAPLGEVIKGALPFTETKHPKKKPFYFLKTLPISRPEKLTLDQATALGPLERALESGQFSPFLLHGVTGSGKTEIYLNLIQKALAKNKEAIILVPEISLTPQLVSRFEDRFPKKIAVLHSKLTSSQRYQEWLKIRNKEVSIAIGARSSLFAPFENLGVIIVDEEHDSSFKQEERVRYNARDLSLVRGQLEQAVVILGSATPSLESTANAQSGKWGYLSLKRRIDERPLPEIEIIDLKNREKEFGQKHIFSERLLQLLTENLDQGNQSILFLNRRGYSPFLLCQECGYIPKCPHCSVSLTVYAALKKLICHYCAHRIPIAVTCPECHGVKISPMGLGTEKVEEILKIYFPKATIARMDRASTRQRHATEKILSDFSNQKIDILIGTQMVAKGHDFPNVTLVGVILADISLSIPDFRAPERTFQLMTQVAGRAGRGPKKGRVVIQTFNPQHYSILCAQSHDYRNFCDIELKIRKELHYPPFSKLVRFKCSDTNSKKALEKIEWFGNICKDIQKNHQEFSQLRFLGPSAAPLAKIKDKHRFHMLLKSPSYKELRLFLKNLLNHEKSLFKSPAIHIDVDPLNLL